MKKIKILVIAGGGVYGIIPCCFLKLLEQNQINNIDVFGGTSAGGILSLHLASFLDTNKLYNDFISNVPNFFSYNFFNLLNPFSSKYSEKGIQKSLQTILNYPIEECSKKFVVPSFSLKTVEPVIFHNFNLSFSNIKLWEIARATSAAPLYFPPYSENILIDGGILQNLPIITTASIVCKYLNKKPEDLDIFAIGTGKTDKNLKRTRKEVMNYSKLQWIQNLLPIITTDGNEMMSELWGKNMGFHYFKLFNPVVIDGIMDNVDKIKQIQNKCDLYKGQFLEQWNDFLKV